MEIDFDLLKRTRTIDPFAVAPIDIQETVAFTPEVMRDDSRSNPEVAGEVGVGVCRVMVASPTPRLRQRLAILGWMPVDPASDATWYIDEPIELRPGDNHLIASFVAQYYAEGMNLLFAPDDGMFSGGAFVVSPGADASREDVRSHLWLLAERAFVEMSMVVPRVRGDWFASAVGRAVARDNSARQRAGLVPIAVPSRSTLGRWLGEIRSRHWDRAGIGCEWRDHEAPPPPPTDAVPPKSATARPREVSTSPSVATDRTLDTTPAAGTRSDRARTIVGRLQAAAREGGRWERIELGAGRTARIWVVDLGDGLEAWLTTRFSGIPTAFEPSGSDEAVLMQTMPPPEADDVLIDLYMAGVGKVLSVGTLHGVDRVIGMTPGPWEARFGLPDRDWSAGVKRRLERRSR